MSLFCVQVSVKDQALCQPCVNSPGGNYAMYAYALTNGELDSPYGCYWACRVPFKLSADHTACEPCPLVNPYHPPMGCWDPLQKVTWGGDVKSQWNASVNNVSFMVFQFGAPGWMRVERDAKADVFVVGGGGAGGGVEDGWVCLFVFQVFLC